MQGPKWPLFYSHVDPMWSLKIVGIGFLPWVELPVQRILCPIFMSGVGLPDIHEYSAVNGLSTDPPVLRRHSIFFFQLNLTLINSPWWEEK